jgi:hypothetical protein
MRTSASVRKPAATTGAIRDDRYFGLIFITAPSELLLLVQ